MYFNFTYILHKTKIITVLRSQYSFIRMLMFSNLNVYASIQGFSCLANTVFHFCCLSPMRLPKALFGLLAFSPKHWNNWQMSQEEKKPQSPGCLGCFQTWVFTFPSCFQWEGWSSTRYFTCTRSENLILYTINS